MKKTISVMFLALFLVTSCLAQGTQAKQTDLYNLNFENVRNGGATGWQTAGDSAYKYALDSTTKVSGKYSVSIEYNGEKSGFGSWIIVIPHSFSGKQITLTGYIKTENVIGSHAGLWLRLDPNMGINNMADRQIKGTNDWQKYSITLNLIPEKIQRIVLGGLMVGKGKMWIDDLRVQIDGQDVEQLEPLKQIQLPADKDKEFIKSSAVTMEMLNKMSVKELAKLGLIWGYLKYYHPSIQKGLYNWDAQLFRIIPRLCNENSWKKREHILTKWIDDLGEYQTTEYVIDTSNVKLYPDLEWIYSSGFSKDLKDRLLRLKNAKRKEMGYYIQLPKEPGKPIFTNEAVLEKPYPDAGYRLLSVYRYWNMIQYFYPYRYLTGKDWKKVLTESICPVIKAENENVYALTMLEVVNKLNDSHASLISKSAPLNVYRGMRNAVPKVEFIEGKAIVTGSYNDSLGALTPLHLGDEIVSVDQKTVKQIIKQRINRTPASNYPTKLRNISQGLFRSNKDQLSISYLHNRHVVKGTISTYAASDIRTLFSYEQSKDTCFKILADSIAYLYIENLKSNYLNEIFEQIKDTKGLIVDLRCYPSDNKVLTMLGAFLESKPTDFAKSTVGSAIHPGLFVFKEDYKLGADNMSPYKGKVIVLVNEMTQSAAEFMAMLIQATSHAIVIGSTTAGADGDISTIDLPGDLITRISGIGIYYPNGNETQRVGIVPDIEVKPTIEGIKAGRDEVLEKAINSIQ